MANAKPKAPMLVLRHLHNTELEIRELVAVRAFQWGVAKKQHFDTLLDMQAVLLLAGTTDKSRHYAREYAEKVVGPVLLSIKERHTRTDKLGVSAPELQTLLEFVPFYRAFWQRQPTELYLVACEELQKYYDSLKETADA